MREDLSELKLQTPPAEFTVLTSAIFNAVEQMSVNMERTARAPIYFSAHDYVTSFTTRNYESIAVASGLPILLGATPFATRAVGTFFGDDIHEGDVFLDNDVYTLDGGNQPQDWCILYPVFYKGEHVAWVSNKAHQQDIGGGAPGGYNPLAMDVYAEGIRIPPLRIFSRGKEIKDVFNFVLANVRIPDTQRGDLMAMIGAARTGEQAIKRLMDRYGKETIMTFIDDLLNYQESMMRREIDKVTDGTYHAEVHGIRGASPVVCDFTVKGTELTVDFSKSGPMVPEYINSTIANTCTCVYIAVMTSIGKRIEYKGGGCYRPIKVVTKPGTITHAVWPATTGHNTNFVAKQIIEVVWSCLAQAIPHETPAGWGSIPIWVYSGVDPRRGEGYGSPDFLSCPTGAGAIWGTDGWPSNGPQIDSGALFYPEIEVVEDLYPIIWEKWEWVTDSGAPGRWRGGCGMHNIWVADGGSEPVNVAYGADPYDYVPAPVIAGGRVPPPNDKKLVFADGRVATHDEIREGKFFRLHSGDKAIDFCTGGCSVGDPLDRDIEAVREDVRDELVSVESARNDYGVVIDPVTFEVDMEATDKLRKSLRQK